MLVLYIGDHHFSGWSMRGCVAVAEKCVPVTERVVELDWPTTENADGVLVVGDAIEEREAYFGCECDPVDLAALDREGMVAGSIAQILPRVPTLVDTDTEVVVTDVLSIAEYLDEIAPQSGVRLMGSTAREQALVRSICGWASHDLASLAHGASYAKSLRPNHGEPDVKAIIQARWLCDSVAALLDRFGGPFVVGPFSLADVMLSTYFQQIHGWRIGIENPVVARYSALLLARSSVAAHLDRARAVYRAINEAQPGSPEWVVRHYRFHRGARLLHNWQADRCERLCNATAEQAVQLAYQGMSLDDITQALADAYRVPIERVGADLAALFAHLAPA
ncbi:glutathione S-transferase family protein [Nocardia sp. CNY236]|uniref:glutathione S-transferase family protein n=1 Tax=Nocardia sp. CNY236 TaxID=1169152 RepID=UPI0003F75308|nr:glutathione S-transferase family protein [Nocardia sp. CNY236]